MSAQNQNVISRMLENLSFKVKFMTVLALPIMAFVYFAYGDISGKLEHRHDAEVIHSVTELNIAISSVIHELQKERGASAVFLKSKGKKFVSETAIIRKEADQKTSALEKIMASTNMTVLSSTATKSLNDAMGDTMKNLSSIRMQINAHSITPKQTGAYYTSFIASLLKVVSESITASNDSEMIRRASAFYNILMAKELAGQERAALAGIFGGESLENKARAKAISLAAGEEAYLTRFKASATSDEVRFLDSKMTGSSVAEVKKMRNVVKMGIAGQNLNVDSGYWFGQSTNRINLINEAGINVADGLIKFTETSMAEISNALNIRFMAIGVLFVFGFIFSFFVARQSIAQERQGAISGSALENLVNNVMVADENDVLMYMNGASQNALIKLQEEICQTFSNFDASKLIGTSIHNFHKNPENVKSILRGLREGEQHTSNVKIGDLTLRLGIGGIYQRGKRIGTYAEWANITAQVAAEETKARIEREVNDVALTINNATRDISQGNVNLSERTEAQAASIEETTATMQQITERVNESAANAKSALEVASTTREAADRGGSVVKDAIIAMQEISESSDKINDIIGVIDEIAFQTNLLALNAAVEAARAGEQGRGFAVVASEVRTLAGRSATAAKEIKDLISESVDKVKVGTQQVNETGGCLEDIITSVQKVTDMVNGISDASQEQALSISEVNKTVTQMDSFTQQNAALVEEAASASKSLEEQASNLVAVMRGEASSSDNGVSANTTATTSKRSAPVAPMSAKVDDSDDGEWKEF